MKTIDVGGRVRVAIKDPSVYAQGCAAALEGRTGVVKRVNYGSVRDLGAGPEPMHLVNFDDGADDRTWWSNQGLVTGFWLAPSELVTL